jgi:hypothetical protein
MERTAQARNLYRRMMRFILRLCRIAVDGAVAMACVLALLVLLFSDSLSDMILANAVGPEDLELPHVAYPMRQAAEYVQTLGGQGQGLNCSLPLGFDWLAFPRANGVSPISLRMRQACVFHDYCYRHGAATYGYTQADCDYMLQEQAFRLCSQIHKNASISQCETAARKVTLGVRLGGAGSFKRADAVPNKIGSTYFEFDPYPLRSTVYQSVRVADTPMDWRRDGASAKAYFLFSIKQSGMEVRIVATGDKGKRFCQVMDLSTRQDIVAVPPLVVRSVADQSDWLVWWRREGLNTTEGKFAGIRPATATLEDWKKAFGAVRTVESDDCLARVPRVMPPAFAVYKSNLPVSMFVDLTPTYERVGWEDNNVDRYVAKDTLVSEFIPQFPEGGSSRTKQPLALYGLTTHGCAEGQDGGSCLAEIEINPSSTEGIAKYEPYVSHDARCIGRDHRLFDAAVRARGEEVCDRYRNYNHAPMIATRDGRPELVWIRRGNSVGDDYPTTATLRRAARRDSDDPTRGKDISGLDNFDNYLLEDYPEELEPSALVDGKLISVYVDGKESSCVELVVITPRKLASQFGEPEATKTPNDVTCLQLDPTWLERPWRVLKDGTLLFLKTTIKQVKGEEDISWDISLKTASLDLNTRRLRISEEQTVATIHSCLNDSGGDAKWILQTSECFSDGARELARGRDDTKREVLAARIMRSAAVVVANIDAGTENAIEDIAFFYQRDGRNPVVLKGRRTGTDTDWLLE